MSLTNQCSLQSTNCKITCDMPICYAGDNVLLYQSICKNKSERKDENRIRKSLKYEKSKSQVGGGAILYTTELYTRIKKKFVLKNHAELYNHSSAWSKCCRQHNRSAYHK